LAFSSVDFRYGDAALIKDSGLACIEAERL
jgi:hypothetical protein